MAKASKKFKPVTDSELEVLVGKHVSNSVNYYDSKLSQERKDVLDYYQGVKPRPAHAGNSKYVSMDVFDAVESLKAVLLETFSAGNKIVSFDPQTAADVEPMRIATEYADYVVHRQNDSFGLFSSVIQDGLMARCGVAKVYWDERTEDVEEEFEGVPMDQVELLMAQDDVSNVEIEHDPDTNTFKGTLTREVDKSQVRIDPIPPEEFLITGTACSIPEASFVAHRTRKTRSELIAMGFSKSKVYSISDVGANDLDLDPERLARFQDTGAGVLSADENASDQEQTDTILVSECYMQIDMDGTGQSKLWKITLAGDTLLDKEVVDRKPFLAFCPIPLPHAFYGSNYAARVIPTQNARTVLVRGILDHTVITNNPRMMVVKGALQNPKELLENRVGGLVNVNRPDGLLPLPQAGLNPFVFQTIQLLDEDKEEVTGVSKLSQGMNKDAVSKQNSAAMMENLVSLSQQREKIIARNFANHFIKPLYLEVYRLVIAHEKKQKVMRVAGNFVPVNPQEWAEEVTCTVELKLGYGEQQMEAQKYMGVHAFLAQDPANARTYTEANRFAMQTKILEKMGIKDANLFLTDPKQLPPAQPDPFKVKEMQLEERKVATQESLAETTAKKVDATAALEQMRAQLERMQIQVQEMEKNRALDIKEFAETSKAALAIRELDLVEKEMEQAPPATQAIVKA